MKHLKQIYNIIDLKITNKSISILFLNLINKKE